MKPKLSRSTRAALLTMSLTGPVALMGVIGLAQGNQKKAATHPKTSKQAYKNIQVLKDLPADQMIPVMHNISLSLGVGCDFCHAVETDAQGRHTGFEKDTKPAKNVARKMIVMTYDLNARYKVVDKKVTCYTCHHGHAMPESTPPAPKTGRATTDGLLRFVQTGQK